MYTDFGVVTLYIVLYLALFIALFLMLRRSLMFLTERHMPVVVPDTLSKC